jgi:uncharacterized protein (DUF2147 family)
MIKHIFACAASLMLAISAPAMASASSAIEGHWTSPRGTLVVRVAPCGDAFCGTVVRASDKARARARKGGTDNLVGTMLLSGVRPDGNGSYSGRAFDPNRNVRVPATIRLDGASTMVVKGCLVGGFLCAEQRWTRVS